MSRGGGLRRVGAMARKEWMHISRDPATLYFALAMPVILLVLFGYALSFELDHIRTSIVDHDHSRESRELVQRLFSGPTFELAGQLEREEDVEHVFRRREAVVALVIPKGFGASLGRGEVAKVQVLVDAADNITAGTTLSYMSGFMSSTNRIRVKELLGSTSERLDARMRALYNPELRSTIFLVPGLIAFIQSMMGVLLTALTVAREWERGSMEQLFATPVGRLEIIVGKLLPYFGVGLTQVLIVLTAGTWLFDVPIRGSLLLLFGISSLFLVACLGQGLLISVVTRNQMLATQIAAVTSMLPAALLSGLIIPIDNMPRILQIFTQILPARHFVSALRGVLLRDASPPSTLPDTAALALFALVMIAASTKKFPKVVA
ncbi:ABC transporter permease [Pendulispora albinea]|uniref:ABC transporter permease n=1 Tax=Pendulispora albinea TaxID=2741071 RepID=A0ABZ2M1K2_9BACT